MFLYLIRAFIRLTVVCETKWNETKWNETTWKSVVCKMKICSLRNENQSVVCEIKIYFLAASIRIFWTENTPPPPKSVSPRKFRLHGMRDVSNTILIRFSFSQQLWQLETSKNRHDLPGPTCKWYVISRSKLNSGGRLAWRWPLHTFAT